MSKLQFSPVDKAFTLSSSQIKDQQEEIDKLTKLILESSIKKQPAASPKEKQQEPVPANVNDKYMRIGYPDKQSAVFSERPPEDNFDYNLLKVIGHPRFDEIVKNYALINHPEWLLKESVYIPQTSKESISYFGNVYSSTVCSNVKNYIIFFVVCVILFLALSLCFKN